MNDTADVTMTHIVDAMKQYGGSFAQQLAQCYYMADPSNRRRLEHAFADLFQSYRDLITAKRRCV